MWAKLETVSRRYGQCPSRLVLTFSQLSPTSPNSVVQFSHLSTEHRAVAGVEDIAHELYKRLEDFKMQSPSFATVYSLYHA